jgi:hypothetical protein
MVCVGFGISQDIERQAPHMPDRFDIALKTAKPVPTATEKVLIPWPERVTWRTVARKVKVLNVEADGAGRTAYCSQGRRWTIR